MSNPEDRDHGMRITDLSAAIAGQIQVIADRLIAVMDDEEFDDITDREVEPVWAFNPVTGELIVGLAIHDGRVVSEINGELIAQHERAGRIEYARLGDDGKPGPWQVAAPPRNRAASN